MFNKQTQALLNFREIQNNSHFLISSRPLNSPSMCLKSGYCSSFLKLDLKHTYINTLKECFRFYPFYFFKINLSATVSSENAFRHWVFCFIFLEFYMQVKSHFKTTWYSHCFTVLKFIYCHHSETTNSSN